MSPSNEKNNSREKVISGEVWSEFCDLLKSAGQQIIDNSANDELERAEGFRYLARLTRNGLASLDSAPLSPVIIDYSGAKIGADNPDFMYGKCRIIGSASYRISGCANEAFTFNIGAFHGQLGTPQGLQSSGFLCKSDLYLDADGRFEIIASKDEPLENNARVDWLPLCEDSNSFLIRQTILRPGMDVPADFEIHIIEGDVGTSPKPLTAKKIENSLGRSALMLHGIVQQFLGWTNDFKKRPNQISEIKPELLRVAKGDPKCQYNYGYFDIADDEALVIKLIPPECEYWNIQLANHWMESFDTSDTVSSINNASAIKRDDGSVYIVIAASAPGLVNYLDTQSHQRGTIALRWVGADSHQADPLMKLFKLVELNVEPIL